MQNYARCIQLSSNEPKIFYWNVQADVHVRSCDLRFIQHIFWKIGNVFCCCFRLDLVSLPTCLFFHHSPSDEQRFIKGRWIRRVVDVSGAPSLECVFFAFRMQTLHFSTNNKSFLLCVWKKSFLCTSFAPTTNTLLCVSVFFSISLSLYL